MRYAKCYHASVKEVFPLTDVFVSNTSVSD